RLDFGGIGKGMALDKAEHILRRYGIKSALLSGGDSSMVAIGAPPGKENWRIGIDNPYNKEDRLGFVSLRDESLSTSACYHFRAGSTEDRPCGIFDPRTGWGVTDMLSATVVAPTGTQTDALSTAFYVMGLEKAREFCANHPEVRAVLVEQPEDGLPEPVKINWAKETN
ncbi:MAG: FAD:protein FMN transferase, partial [Candidatus Hydrogenedentes bacterium]|nr:FAD:protein FMN transferase [Candidatus Hydrogenedentota bacterium]